MTTTEDEIPGPPPTAVVKHPPPRIVPPGPNGTASANGELPEHRKKQVEAGLATYQTMLAERDDLERQLLDATRRNGELEVQLEALRNVVNMMESTYSSTKIAMEDRVAQHQQQRDDAVRREARVSAILMNIYLLVRDQVDPTPSADMVAFRKNMEEVRDHHEQRLKEGR